MSHLQMLPEVHRCSCL